MTGKVAHKTITISEEAYDSLAELKREGESFTEVILRISGKHHRKAHFLSWIEGIEPLTDLADAVEGVLRERDNWRFRSGDL